MDSACAGIDRIPHRRILPIAGLILLSTACGARSGLDTLSASVGGTNSYGGASSNPGCLGADVGPKRLDGGLVQIGNTDPSKGMKLDDGGFFTSDEYKGYCFTYADKYASDGTNIDGSTMYPPCGNKDTSGKQPDCFTKATGLCPTASLGVASKNGNVWGGGLGCNLNQKAGTGTVANSVSLIGKTTLSVEIYGCKTPNILRLQLNIDNPVFDDAGLLGSGYYCSDAPVSAPDSNGIRKATVKLTKLTQDCWKSNLVLDTSTLTAASAQVQINADPTKRTDWDFCVSKLSLD